MNKEAFDELTRKANRAKTLVGEIEQLQRADPKRNAECILTVPRSVCSVELLPIILLKEVIDVGRNKLIADREAELESILNPKCPDIKADGSPSQESAPFVLGGGCISYDGPAIPIQKAAGCYVGEPPIPTEPDLLDF